MPCNVMSLVGKVGCGGLLRLLISVQRGRPSESVHVPTATRHGVRRGEDHQSGEQ